MTEREVEKRAGSMIARCALGALVVALCVLPGPVPARASALRDLAASMKPGTWAELETKGMTPELLEVPHPVMIYNVLEYQNSGVWDPVTRQVLFVGGPHGGTGKFISYDEASNTWRHEPDPTPASMLSTHGYDHNTLNTATGDLYFRPYASANVYKYQIATKIWSHLTRIPNTQYNCCGAIEFFPERDGFVFVGRNEVLFYNTRRGSWSAPWTTIRTGPYHATAEYSPTAKVVVFGGGSGVRTVYRMDRNGRITPGADSPFPLDSGGHAIFTADPVSGQFLLFAEDETFHVYDAVADRWELQGQRPPFFDTGKYRPVSCSIAIPISTHGVVMVLTYATRRPTVFLYKHAAGAPTPR
jgi:hypothetical protein